MDMSNQVKCGSCSKMCIPANTAAKGNRLYIPLCGRCCFSFQDSKVTQPPPVEAEDMSDQEKCGSCSEMCIPANKADKRNRSIYVPLCGICCLSFQNHKVQTMVMSDLEKCGSCSEMCIPANIAHKGIIKYIPLCKKCCNFSNNKAKAVDVPVQEKCGSCSKMCIPANTAAKRNRKYIPLCGICINSFKNYTVTHPAPVPAMDMSVQEKGGSCSEMCKPADTAAEGNRDYIPLLRKCYDYITNHPHYTSTQPPPVQGMDISDQEKCGYCSEMCIPANIAHKGISKYVPLCGKCYDYITNHSHYTCVNTENTAVLSAGATSESQVLRMEESQWTTKVSSASDVGDLLEMQSIPDKVSIKKEPVEDFVLLSDDVEYRASWSCHDNDISDVDESLGESANLTLRRDIESAMFYSTDDVEDVTWDSVHGRKIFCEDEAIQNCPIKIRKLTVRCAGVKNFITHCPLCFVLLPTCDTIIQHECQAKLSSERRGVEWPDVVCQECPQSSGDPSTADCEDSSHSHPEPLTRPPLVQVMDMSDQKQCRSCSKMCIPANTAAKGNRLYIPLCEKCCNTLKVSKKKNKVTGKLPPPVQAEKSSIQVQSNTNLKNKVIVKLPHSLQAERKSIQLQVKSNTNLNDKVSQTLPFPSVDMSNQVKCGSCSEMCNPVNTAAKRSKRYVPLCGRCQDHFINLPSYAFTPKSSASAARDSKVSTMDARMEELQSTTTPSSASNVGDPLEMKINTRIEKLPSILADVKIKEEPGEDYELISDKSDDEEFRASWSCHDDDTAHDFISASHVDEPLGESANLTLRRNIESAMFYSTDDVEDVKLDPVHGKDEVTCADGCDQG